jgi:hypothetical protein
MKKMCRGRCNSDAKFSCFAIRAKDSWLETP